MTPTEYTEAVDRIEQGNPREPLLKLFRSGFSKVNLIYLKAALGRLPETVENGVQEDDTLADRRPIDPILRGLWSERTRLFTEMNRLSNTLHDCQTDEQRATVSKAILRQWDEILAAKERIRYYEEHGKMPEPVSEEKYPLPDEPFALAKKLNSIRAMISQVQKEIRDLVELDDDHPDKADRVRDAEARRTHLIYYRGHAEQKIKRAAIHAG